MADKKLNIKVRADGAKRAKKELKGVDNGLKSLGTSALKAGAAFVGAAGLISGLKKSVEAFASQELAEKKLEAALGRTSQALLNQAAALQKVSVFGDEAIITQQAFLASLEFTEEQIGSIIRASIDLSAATGISLESAVRNTAKTFSGLSGELGELIPQLRDLTAEEMKAGEAVKLIADLFGGQAKEQTETLSGQMQQLGNAVGDLAEKFGEKFLVKSIKSATTAMKDFAEQIGDEKSGTNKAFDFFRKILDRVNPGLAKKIELTNKDAEATRKQREEAEKVGAGEELFTPEQAIQLGIITKDLEAQTLQIRRQGTVELQFQEVTYKEINTASKKAAEFAATTASSLMTSALMGDNVSDSLKRAVIQLGLMVAQAKVYNALMSAGSIFSGGGFLGSAVNFLFGASPTRTAPSASGASNAKITINQSFGGMGVIDHNFAANSIIPAINKAISTGQARIN